MADEESQEKPPQPESVADGDVEAPAAPATPPPPPSPSPPPTPPPPEVCRLCGEESEAKVDIFGDEGRGLGLPDKCHNCLPLLVRRPVCLLSQNAEMGETGRRGRPGDVLRRGTGPGDVLRRIRSPFMPTSPPFSKKFASLFGHLGRESGGDARG